jgi:hypothetical protein
MRTLLPVPDGALDGGTSAPRFGSYRGGLPRVDLSPLLSSGLTRIKKHKRWMYVAIVRDDLYIAVCVLRLGYAANAWAFAYDARASRLRVDRSLLAAPSACRIGDAAGEGCEVTFVARGERIAIARAAGSSVYTVETHVRGLDLRARLESRSAPPAITAIAPLGGAGLLDVTEKRTLLEASGEAIIDGEHRSLDGAAAGYDYTSGIMARRTAWHWAFLLGRAESGERVALNLVEGFAGEAECAAWVDGDLFPLGEGRFTFDAQKPLRPWGIAAGGNVDLRFWPGASHVERRNLGIISSRFVHPIGVFAGTIEVGGRRLVIERALGVTEDQDVTW